MYSRFNRNNSETNVATAVTLSSMVILPILSVLLLKLLLKTTTNHKKMPFIYKLAQNCQFLVLKFRHYSN